jgi:hypothetical protein
MHLIVCLNFPQIYIVIYGNFVPISGGSRLNNIKYSYLIATSAPAERIFSSAADVITYERASLSPKTVQAIMCLKHWYRSGILD